MLHWVGSGNSRIQQRKKLMKIPCMIEYLRGKLGTISDDKFIVPVLFFTTLLRFRSLGHESIKYWSELIHAIVPMNLTKHILMPTLGKVFISTG
jgi:hypothetical protein